MQNGRKQTVYVAIPTYNKTVAIETAITLLELQIAIGTAYLLQFVFHSSSQISELRNVIVANFLAGEYDFLLMIDADQGFPPSLIARMLESGHPVMGAIYPRRNFFWPERFVSAEVKLALAQSLRFVGEIDVDESGTVQVINGFVRAKSIGAGAMLVRRDVFSRLAEKFPELKGQGFPAEDEYEGLSAHNWGFFNPIRAQGNSRNLGEDISFCARWRGCGGEIWADITCDITHVGTQIFRGNYENHLGVLLQAKTQTFDGA